MLPAARDETDGLRTEGALISWTEVPCLALLANLPPFLLRRKGIP